jgi:16S rRNA (cytidine1402-2'-O)-methyltransferase
MKTQGKIFLLPSPLTDEFNADLIIPAIKDIALNITHFVVENERTAKRFLKKLGVDINQESLQFKLLNVNTTESELGGLLAPCLAGNDIAIISECGCPAIADPGADLVALAQTKDVKIVPLPGPSSILLALMGSGLNGQCFAFHGYLPIDAREKKNAIKNLENRSIQNNETQLFIETPYRNLKLLEDFLSELKPTTRLCIAAGICSETELIKTKTVAEWKGKLPEIHKIPTVFCFLAESFIRKEKPTYIKDKNRK